MNKYFRINTEDQKGIFQYLKDDGMRNLLHSLTMEIEKKDSLYNRFMNLYTIEFYNFNEDKSQMELIKSFKFTELNNYGKPKQTNE